MMTTLFLTLVAGAGCSKNSEEVLSRAHEAADAHCACIAEAMNKPLAEIHKEDCAATKASFYEVIKSVDQNEEKGEAIYLLGSGCINKLNEVLDQKVTDLH